MNPLDRGVLDFFGQAWLHPPQVHAFIQDCVAGNNFLKGAVLVGALWWIWMQPHPDQRTRRELIVVAILGALLAALVSRSFAQLVPFRARPFSTPGVHLQAPVPRLYDIKGGSFPSDHMALAFSLVAGVFLVSRRAGVALGTYALLVVGLPRVYLGIHWATDIIGGSLLGIVVVAILSRPGIRGPVSRPIFGWMERTPGLFYACLFVTSFGLMTRFDDVRMIVAFVLHAGLTNVQP